jgi:hypothetical protein
VADYLCCLFIFSHLANTGVESGMGIRSKVDLCTVCSSYKPDTGIGVSQVYIKYCLKVIPD